MAVAIGLLAAANFCQLGCLFRTVSHILATVCTVDTALALLEIANQYQDTHLQLAVQGYWDAVESIRSSPSNHLKVLQV